MVPDFKEARESKTGACIGLSQHINKTWVRVYGEGVVRINIILT